MDYLKNRRPPGTEWTTKPKGHQEEGSEGSVLTMHTASPVLCMSCCSVGNIAKAKSAKPWVMKPSRAIKSGTYLHEDGE